MTKDYHDGRGDLTGQIYGRLTVLSLSIERTVEGKRQWHCRCECGAKCLASTKALRNGTKASCGCLQRERAGTEPRHGMSHAPEYNAWCQMKQRCHNPRNRRWADYGGRGIGIHPPWARSFEAFFADLGPKPAKHYTLGRIDNDGHYVPGNVEWQTPAQQRANQRAPKKQKQRPPLKDAAFEWRGRHRTNAPGGE